MARAPEAINVTFNVVGSLMRGFDFSTYVTQLEFGEPPQQDEHVKSYTHWLAKNRVALLLDIRRALTACFPDRAGEQMTALEGWLRNRE